MAVLVPPGVWHSNYAIFPSQVFNKSDIFPSLNDKQTFLNEQLRNEFPVYSNSLKSETQSNRIAEERPYSLDYGGLKSFTNKNHRVSQGRSIIFHWNTLEDKRAGGDISINERGDDGVVLLVGLFNLLAVVAYVGHKLLAGELSKTDKRIVLWQVQKVLDELVLRVHSSETASNLLSRALRSSSEGISGRKMDDNSISTFILQILNEKNPQHLQDMLNKTIDRLQKEIASSPQSLRGAMINPVIYKPLTSFYRKLTEPGPRERAFSSSILQEVSAVTRVVNKMSLKEVQNVLSVIGRIGSIHRRYDLAAVLESMMPTEVVKGYGTETIFDESKHNLRLRAKRETDHQQMTLLQKRPRQRSNSKYPHFSKSALRYKARRMKEMAKMKANAKATQKSLKENEMRRRKGTVENVHQEDLVTNWADGWFTLLTLASPVALDISTLYTRSGKEPRCLRSFLCKANGYWRRRGAFQATLSPFLSVLASWALEGMTPHSLGDSLIAVRAGWMGKTCGELFPECQREDAPHPLVRQALKVFENAREGTSLESLDSIFLSKSGEYELKTDPVLEKEKPKPLQVTHPPLTSPTTLTELPSPETSSSYASQPPMDDYDPLHQHETLSQQFKPYNRYDQPFLFDNSLLPSGSITGMALQDRPVERMEVEESEESEKEETPHHESVVKNHRFAGWNADKDIRGPQASPFSNDGLSQSVAGSLNYNTYVPNQIPSDDRHKDSGPSFLHQPDYSSYMSLQQPVFIKQRHRSIAGLNHRQQPGFYLSPHRNESAAISRPTKPLKYKYGLRRGLPSRNVDGLPPLFETSTTERVPKPFKLNPKKRYKHNKDSSKYNSHHQSHAKFHQTANHPNPTDTVKEPDPNHGKYVTHFTYKDAITDPLRNTLLFQYIRDRRISDTS